MRHLVPSLALVALLSCSKSAPSGPEALSVSPQQLMEELIADRGAALERYGGKRIEVSGVVGLKTDKPTAHGIAFQETSERSRFDANVAFFFFDSEDQAAVGEQRAIAVGQKLTLVCEFKILDREREMFLVELSQQVCGRLARPEPATLEGYSPSSFPWPAHRSACRGSGSSS